jgi:hypothetical protein
MVPSGRVIGAVSIPESPVIIPLQILVIIFSKIIENNVNLVCN